MAEATDGDLVRMVRSGDPGAALELYQRHVGAVRTTVAGRVRATDLVEEVTQEAFTRALERLGDLRRPERFRSWLLTIARNSANDRWRLDRRQRSVDTAELGALGTPSPGADDEGTRRALSDLLGRGLGHLSPRDARALALVAQHDLGPAEVGAALGLSPGAAKVAVHRARRRLRTALAADVLRRFDRLPCGGGPEGDLARHVADCAPCLTAADAHLTELVAA
jgi:RNA polymerase sigma factor (sigma-70 family)